jgi:hypothetical protein
VTLSGLRDAPFPAERGRSQYSTAEPRRPSSAANSLHQLLSRDNLAPQPLAVRAAPVARDSVGAARFASPAGVNLSNGNQSIKDQSAKQYRLWHVSGQSEFVAIVTEADTFEEIKSVRRRTDWRYQVMRDGMPIDDETGFPILTLPGQDLNDKE